MREVLLMIDAFGDTETEAWKRTRFQSYILYCTVTDENKRRSIYEFLPLESDPTPEEIERMQLEEEERQKNEAVEIYNSMKDYL